MTTYTRIDLMRTSSRERAEKLRAVLQGETYMNLDFCAAPDGGELQLSVATTHEFDADEDGERELLEMVLQVLTWEATQ